MSPKCCKSRCDDDCLSNVDNGNFPHPKPSHCHQEVKNVTASKVSLPQAKCRQVEQTFIPMFCVDTLKHLHACQSFITESHQNPPTHIQIKKRKIFSLHEQLGTITSSHTVSISTRTVHNSDVTTLVTPTSCSQQHLVAIQQQAVAIPT